VSAEPIAVAGPAAAAGRRADADAAPPVERAERESAATVALRVALFAAFALFGAIFWFELVAAPPDNALIATVGAATACAAVLALLDRSPLPRPAVSGLAALAVLAALAAGLVACGVEARLLLPGNWDELATLIDRSLLGVQTVDWPYDGPDAWVRTTILLGAPPLLTAAAACAFWPAPPEARAPLRATALVALIALYAIAVTTQDPGSPILLGLLLLALIAGWLWLPRRRGRELAGGVAALLAAALLALPLATALDGEEAWFDYRSWSPFGAREGVAFGWDHQYGPLDWPRQGTTLLTVRSDSPHYWKAQTLNGFDGVRWYRSTGYEPRSLDAELPFDGGTTLVDEDEWAYGEGNAEWAHRARFTVRSLSTELIVGAGLTYDLAGADASPSADGTTLLLGDPLERGDSYWASFYQPNPSRDQMVGAPTRYPDWVERYTEIDVPEAGGDPTDGGTTLAVPPRGNPAPAAERRNVDALLRGSAYSRTYDLAQRLTSSSPTVYDAVESVENHLLASYRYSERVPERTYPLDSFLFEDRRGYCQQFSGAMALMLRMAGIPARVAAGFSPGTRDEESGEFRVRDLDAHSWVEVYFAGIGWVTFDPTPRAAESDPTAALATGTGSAAAGVVRQGSSDPLPTGPSAADDEPDAGVAADFTGGAGADSSGGGTAASLLPLAAGIAAVALLAALAFALRVRRRRGLGRDQLAAAETAELREALHRLGWDLAPATTLLGLEHQLATHAGPSAAAYAHALRSYRFDPRHGEPPGPADRRVLRRALATGRGPLGHLRALLALPPGGPGAPASHAASVTKRSR
jgi:protein-glutamine gamma-glutamyltransferase